VLIHNNEKWTELVKAGKFEEKKALLSMKIKSTDLQKVNPKSIQEVFENETPTLATVKKYQGEIDMNATLHYLIYWVRDSLSVGKSLTDKQIAIAGELIFDDYYYLTIADFKLCFKKGIKGEYGKLYDRIDTQILYEWVSAYANERFEYIRELGSEETEHNKKEYYDAAIVKKMQDMLEKKVRKELVEKQYQKTFHYQTIESWCAANNIDPVEKTKDLKLMWRMEYNSKPENETVSFELFCAFKVGEFLSKVNSINECLKSNK